MPQSIIQDQMDSLTSNTWERSVPFACNIVELLELQNHRVMIDFLDKTLTQRRFFFALQFYLASNSKRNKRVLLKSSSTPLHRYILIRALVTEKKNE